MRYRFASAADAPMLAQLNRELIQDEGHRNPMTVPELERRMADWLAGEYQAVVFEESSPLGYALFRRETDHIYLRQFFISRARRRQKSRACGHHVAASERLGRCAPRQIGRSGRERTRDRVLARGGVS